MVSRLALLELLSRLMESSAGEDSRAESFFSAMDAAARKLGDGQG